MRRLEIGEVQSRDAFGCLDHTTSESLAPEDLTEVNQIPSLKAPNPESRKILNPASLSPKAQVTRCPSWPQPA